MITWIPLLVLLFSLITPYSISDLDHALCRNFPPDFKFEPRALKEQKQRLPFCSDHSGRTCCTEEDAIKIYTEFAGAVQNEDIVSPSCLLSLQSLSCAVCDGNIVIFKQRQGIGLIQAICPNVCMKAYESCQTSLFSPGQAGRSKLELCNPSSLVCSKLQQIAISPQQFCKLFSNGIPIEWPDQNEDLEQQYRPCFQGKTAASLLGKISQTTPKKKEEPGWLGFIKSGISVLKIIGAMAMVFSVILLIGGLCARICLKKRRTEDLNLTRREKHLRRQQKEKKQ